MDEYELNELIVYLIRKQKKKTLYDACDLYQEAMLIVPIAMKTWDKNRNAALKTHITNCIVNRFTSLSRKEKKWLISESSLFDERDISQFKTDIPSDELAQFEFDYTMKQILTKEEFQFYRRYFVYGDTIREICSKYKISPKRLQVCLQSICHKYKSLEESLQKISTQRRLSASFLHSSDQAS